MVVLSPQVSCDPPVAVVLVNEEGLDPDGIGSDTRVSVDDREEGDEDEEQQRQP